ncbi:MAG: hypothetical protein SVR81_10625, partial [Chloroflexota bacterium]|nr:hypothetical protein [Chloroflexota bacterium]
PGYRFHRVKLNRSVRRRAWTLFVHGPRVKGWGFMDTGNAHPGATIGQYNYTFFTAYSAGSGPGWHKTAEKGRDVKRYRRH